MNSETVIHCARKKIDHLCHWEGKLRNTIIIGNKCCCPVCGYKLRIKIQPKLPESRKLIKGPLLNISTVKFAPKRKKRITPSRKFNEKVIW